jgi:hypothetical protein
MHTWPKETPIHQREPWSRAPVGAALIIAEPEDDITIHYKMSPRYAVALWEAIQKAEPANPVGIVADFLVTTRRTLDPVRVKETR